MANAGRLLAALAAALFLLGTNAGRVADAGPAGSHPYFDDQGTLAWSRSYEEARAAARAEGKLLFIEFGRRECGNCRTLVQRVLPAAGLRERMASLCVGFAAECDEPDPRVEALFSRHLAGAGLLPFVAFTTPDLEWVSGWAGTASADALEVHLRAAEARRPARPAHASMADVRPAIRTPAPVTVAAAPLSTMPSPALSARTALPAAEPAPAARPVPDERRLAVAPSAPRAPSAPVAAAATRADAADLLPRARTASAAGRHGEALRMWEQARDVPSAGSADAWAPVVARADVWAEECLRAAVRAARERRWSDAEARLDEIRREAPHRPAARDAFVGHVAIERLRGLDRSTACGLGATRDAAVAEFRGTRWTRIFTNLP